MSKYGVFSGSYFPAFELNTEQKTPYLDTFPAVLAVPQPTLSHSRGHSLSHAMLIIVFVTFSTRSSPVLKISSKIGFVIA